VRERTGWTWLSTVQEGRWRGLGAIPVDIPATWAGSGASGIGSGSVTRQQGIREPLVPDECGAAVCYLVCEPSNHGYRDMTRSDRMPV
jgi:hypothetical protein